MKYDTETTDANIENNRTRSILPYFSADDLNGLSSNLRGTIITIRQLDPEIVESQLRVCVAKLFMLAILFGDDARTF